MWKEEIQRFQELKVSRDGEWASEVRMKLQLVCISPPSLRLPSGLHIEMAVTVIKNGHFKETSK